MEALFSWSPRIIVHAARSTEPGFWDWFLASSAGACTLVMLALRYGLPLAMNPQQPLEVPALPWVTQLMIHVPYVVPLVAGGVIAVGLPTMIWLPSRLALRRLLLGLAFLAALLGLAAIIWAFVAPPLYP